MGIDVVYTSNLEEVMQKIDETARDRMFEAVNEVRNETFDTLTGPRSGRSYTVPGTKRTYTASAPGEPPAQRLGELRQSITAVVEGEGKEVVGMVGTDKDYGPSLEFGTLKMAARPWLRKTFEKTEDKVKEIFTRLWFE